MTDLIGNKALQSAYLCLKDSISDDILSYSELKHALQYAGFNPTPGFLQRVWVEGQTEKLSFEDFCSLSAELQPINENYINKTLSNVFIIDNDKISIKDLKNVLLKSKRKKLINEYDIDLLVDEVGGENGFIKVSNISKIICETVFSLKKVSLKSLEHKNAEQRIDSRTYTKDQMSSKQQNSIMSLSSSISSINTEGWENSNLKGSFFFDKDAIISHQYSVEIPAMVPTLFKISPLINGSSSAGSINFMAFIFRESKDGSRTYLGYTNRRTIDGASYWVDTLKEGKYIIVPYLSASYFKQERKSFEKNELQLVEKGNKIKLTSDCIEIIKDIFNQMDLDCNGLLNRQEFNLYNWRTSAEIVQDDEWDVVQNNFDVQDGELTLDGFISLHQLEAEDNEGDSEDLWLSLETIGYNRQGEQVSTVPFLFGTYCQQAKSTLAVSGLKSGGLLLDKALIRSVIEESEPFVICDNSDLIKYQYVGESRGAIVIQNKSNQNLKMRVDCSSSVNAVSNRANLDWELILDKKSAIVAHQLSPKVPNHAWIIHCQEEIL